MLHFELISFFVLHHHIILKSFSNSSSHYSHSNAVEGLHLLYIYIRSSSAHLGDPVLWRHPPFMGIPSPAAGESVTCVQNQNDLRSLSPFRVLCLPFGSGVSVNARKLRLTGDGFLWCGCRWLIDALARVTRKNGIIFEVNRVSVTYHVVSPVTH